LDDALGAEDMLEQLTERNLTLTEQLEDLKATVDDLEALKDLNDELEDNHIETQKQLLEEIEIKERAFAEQFRKVEFLEESVVDYEGTIAQFRDLVTSLQRRVTLLYPFNGSHALSDLDSVREQQTSALTEQKQLSSQTQAMLNLNLKLQNTVSKTQVKTIDLELRKLEAQQASERLNVVKHYLPPSFFSADADAVDAFLFFDRLAHKSELIAGTIGQKHNIVESLTSIVPESLVAVCEVCLRFALLDGTTHQKTDSWQAAAVLDSDQAFRRESAPVRA
jgi:dynactin 1